MLSNKFCAAAWFGLRIDNTGNFQMCCKDRINESAFEGKKNYNIHDHTVEEWLNSDYMQYVRRELEKDNPIPECRKCWSDERQGFGSLRQKYNAIVLGWDESHCEEDNYRSWPDLEESWLKDYFNQKQDYTYDQILIADAKISNLCNYSCASCNPWDSTTIYAEWKKNPDEFFVQAETIRNPDYFNRVKSVYQDDTARKHLDFILEHPLVFLKILGGEPMLDSKFMEKLSKIPKNKKAGMWLHFVTNGSVNIRNTINKLESNGKFKKITVAVSIDAYGDLNDYVRRKSSWDVIESNILDAKTIDYPRVEPYVQCTISALNILKIHELEEWTAKHGFYHNFGYVERPSYMAMHVIPDLAKKLITKNPAIVNLVSEQKFSESDYAKFKEFIAYYDKDSEYKFSEFYDW